MTTTRLSLAIALAAAAGSASLLAAGGGAEAAPTERVLADYCLEVDAVYYHDRVLFGGGIYCVPAPGA